MQDLRISFVQLDTLWEDIEGNLAQLTDIVKEVPKESDLLVLPETFSTGFTMEPEKWAETMNGKAVNWMRTAAQEKDLIVAGSLVIKEDNAYFNRFVFVHPDGSVQYYNKRHLFSLAGEDEHYNKGDENIIVEVNGWKIRPQVCYDLRFPVWSKNTDNYDVLLYTANWPAKRIEHWRKLLMARAIENQSYVIGVNRVGTDGNQLEYNGNSMCVGPMGDVLTEVVDKQGLINMSLEYSPISSFRDFLSVLNDSDQFTID